MDNTLLIAVILYLSGCYLVYSSIGNCGHIDVGGLGIFVVNESSPIFIPLKIAISMLSYGYMLIVLAELCIVSVILLFVIIYTKFVGAYHGYI